jgi:hypothetical protein
LLRKHGFVGKAAEQAVIAKLKAEYGMEELRYRAKENRSLGCRIAGRPVAKWIEADE